MSTITVYEEYMKALYKFPIKYPTFEDLESLCPHLSEDELKELMGKMMAGDGFSVAIPSISIKGGYIKMEFVPPRDRTVAAYDRNNPEGVLGERHEGIVHIPTSWFVPSSAHRTRESYPEQTEYIDSYASYGFLDKEGESAPFFMEAIDFSGKNWPEKLRFVSWEMEPGRVEEFFFKTKGEGHSQAGLPVYFALTDHPRDIKTEEAMDEAIIWVTTCPIEGLEMNGGEPRFSHSVVCGYCGHALGTAGSCSGCQGDVGRGGISDLVPVCNAEYLHSGSRVESGGYYEIQISPKIKEFMRPHGILFEKHNSPSEN